MDDTTTFLEELVEKWELRLATTPSYDPWHHGYRVALGEALEEAREARDKELS